MWLRNKESHPPQAAAVRGQATRHGQVRRRPRLGAELHQPSAIEAVDAVILAEMARQSPQISLLGDPFGIFADLVWTNLAPLDRLPGVEQRFDAFQPFFRLQRTGAIDQGAAGPEHVDGRPQ